jgi:hypothetical protein
VLAGAGGRNSETVYGILKVRFHPAEEEMTWISASRRMGVWEGSGWGGGPGGPAQEPRRAVFHRVASRLQEQEEAWAGSARADCFPLSKFDGATGRSMLSRNLGARSSSV